MTSKQTGEAWINEILNGHPIRCVNAFRMSASMFTQLCEDLHKNYGLTSTDRMSVKEKVGIFLYTLSLGLSNRDVAERFQRSEETVSRDFHKVLESICGRSK
jgi:DNA-binding NarL/FixJ family response regulator